MKKFLLLAVLCSTIFNLQAQSVSMGFQTGLNFSQFKGPTEKDGNGNALEEFVNTSGFQIGATANYPIIDILGIRGEFVFSQLGGRYRYHGQGYLFLPTEEANKSVLVLGNKNLTLNISNAYFYLPLSVYLKPIRQIELSAGAGMGFLISSTAVGQLRFSGLTEGGQMLDTLEISLSYNYLKDQTGENSGPTQQTLILDGESIPIPGRAGAYWLNPRLDTGPFFNRWDFSLHTALNIYLGRSLYLGGKIQYGLNDLTRNDYDYSAYRLDAQKQPIARNDKDTQLSYQIRVGFNF